MMAAMESLVELRDPDIRTGMDGAELKGLSVLSKQLLSASSMAPETSGVVALAGKLAHNAGTKDLAGESPVAGHDEIAARVTIFAALIARILSWFPPLVSRPLLRTNRLRQKLAVIDALLPPAPAALARAPAVTVREHVVLNRSGQSGAGVTASGQVTINMAVYQSITQAALKRHFRKIPSKSTASAGYLLFSGRPTLEWHPSLKSPGLGQTIGRHVVALEDLFNDPGFAELRNGSISDQTSSGLSMPVQATLDYGLPVLLAASSRISKLFVIAASIPGEGEIRRLDFTIALRPCREDLNFPQLYPATLEITLPPEYPPVEHALATISENAKWKHLDIISVTMPEVGSGATLATSGAAPLNPGDSMVVSLTFRDEKVSTGLPNEAGGIVDKGGRAALRFGFTYDRPWSGIEICAMASRSGRLSHPSRPIEVMADSLQFDVVCDLVLDDLKFPMVKREAWTEPAGAARNVNMAYVQRLVNRLADDHILVRQILEGQSSGYVNNEKTDATWDLHARYEESMAGPDVHIGIRSDSNPDSSLATFEVTVLGRGVFHGEQDHVQKVKKMVGMALGEVASASSARRPWRGAGDSSEPPAPEASEPNSFLEQNQAVQGMDVLLQKLENLVQRFENLVQTLEMRQD